MRVAAFHPDPGEPLELAGAQLVVAREHGFPSWPRLRAYMERAAAFGPGLRHAYREDVEYFEGRASGLLASARDATGSAVAVFARWDAPLSPSGARPVIAREHGFATWGGAARARGGSARGRRAVRARVPRLTDASGNQLIGRQRARAARQADPRSVAVAQ